MPEFFLPGAEDDPGGAEEAYASIRKFNADQLTWPISERRIFRVEYRHPTGRNKKRRSEWNAEVGKIFDFTGEVCIAIFESNSFLVCTPNREVLRGEPVLIGQPHTVIDFDDAG